MPVELGTGAFWSVVAVGALSGTLSVMFLRRWSDGAKLRVCINLIWAHLLEFQLFADEPRLLLGAQRDLFIANWRMLRLMLIPSLVLALPFVILLAGLDAVFGRAPLHDGEATVVTARFSRSPLPSDSVRIEPPPGVLIDTPSVTVPTNFEVSWRVSTNRPVSGDLLIRYAGQVFHKSISSSSGLQWLSERRFGMPLSRNAMRFIEVRYPSATVLHLHWLVWFSVASMAGAGISGFVAPALRGSAR